MKYRNAPRAIAAILPDITGPAVRKRGFAEMRILAEWPAIAGDVLARQSMPEKLHFPRGRAEGATLHIKVSGAFATELQHLEPQVIERINRYFGYAAVAAVKLRQAPMETKAARPRPRGRAAANPMRDSALDKTLENIEDDGLREALKRLGREIPAANG